MYIGGLFSVDLEGGWEAASPPPHKASRLRKTTCLPSILSASLSYQHHHFFFITRSPPSNASRHLSRGPCCRHPDHPCVVDSGKAGRCVLSCAGAGGGRREGGVLVEPHRPRRTIISQYRTYIVSSAVLAVCLSLGRYNHALTM